MKTPFKQLHWSPVASLASHKGGIQHQPKHFQLDKDTVHVQIQKAYKRYGKLKNNKNRCDTWLASLVEVQATALQVSKKSIWTCIRQTKHTQNNVRMKKSSSSP